MSRSPPVLLAVAALLVLSGCGGTPGSTPATTATSTPSPTPEPTTAPTDDRATPGDGNGNGTTGRTTATEGDDDANASERFPPGLGAAGIVDPAALAGAHRDALANRSVTVIQRHARYVSGERVGWRNVTSDHAADRTRYLLEVNDSRGGPFAVWSNGSLTLRRQVADGASEYERLPDRAVDPTELVSGYWNRSLTDVLGGLGNATVQPADGEFCVTAGNVTDPVVVVAGGNGTGASGRIENVSVRLVVEPSGLVRSLRIEYTDTAFGSRVVERFRFEAVGATEVRRPAWVAEGLNRTADGGD